MNWFHRLFHTKHDCVVRDLYGIEHAGETILPKETMDYQTKHDGGNPYRVSIDTKTKIAYVIQRGENCELLLTHFQYQHVWIGQNPFSTTHNKFYLKQAGISKERLQMAKLRSTGQSILFGLDNNRYLFVGAYVVEFSTTSKVLRFFSDNQLRNSVYSCAICEDYCYFFIDQPEKVRTSDLRKHVKNSLSVFDPVQAYYDDEQLTKLPFSFRYMTADGSEDNTDKKLLYYRDPPLPVLTSLLEKDLILFYYEFGHIMSPKHVSDVQIYCKAKNPKDLWRFEDKSFRHVVVRNKNKEIKAYVCLEETFYLGSRIFSVEEIKITAPVRQEILLNSISVLCKPFFQNKFSIKP